MMKLLGVIIFSMFGILLLTDVLTIYTTKFKLENAISQAVDAAYISSTQEEDFKRGFVTIDEAEAEHTIRMQLINNLKLNSNMENDIYKNSVVNVNTHYDSDDNPRIEAEFKTQVTIISGKVVGIDTFPVEISKKTPFIMLPK